MQEKICQHRWKLRKTLSGVQELLISPRHSAGKIHTRIAPVPVVLLVKRKTLILYSFFHRTFMFVLLVSVTFYRCIDKCTANYVCHISRLSWKYCCHIEKSLMTSVCKLKCTNVSILFKILGFNRDWQQLQHSVIIFLFILPHIILYKNCK